MGRKEGKKERWVATQSGVLVHSVTQRATTSNGLLDGRCSRDFSRWNDRLNRAPCPLWKKRRKENFSAWLLLVSGFSFGKIHPMWIYSLALPGWIIQCVHELPLTPVWGVVVYLTLEVASGDKAWEAGCLAQLQVWRGEAHRACVSYSFPHTYDSRKLTLRYPAKTPLDHSDTSGFLSVSVAWRGISDSF